MDKERLKEIRDRAVRRGLVELRPLPRPQGPSKGKTTMGETLKTIVEYFGKRKAISAVIAALFVAAYLFWGGVLEKPTSGIEDAQKKCNSLLTLIGVDCGEKPETPVEE